MTGRLIGAIIALLVVVAVGVTSLRLISFSFQEQASSPDSNQAMQQVGQRDETETTLAFIMQMHEVREPAEARLVADAERRWRETEQRQADLGQRQEQADLRQRQEEERKLAEARRHAEQQQRERREAQQREADLTRRLEEQRKLAQVWLQDEQERQRREAQLEADLRRMREDERKLGVGEVRPQAEKQRQRTETEPVRKSEGRVAVDPKAAESELQQTDGKLQAGRKRGPTQTQASAGEERQARPARARVKRQTMSPLCMFLAELSGDVRAR